uniref:Tropomyosin n=1 Tax=Panagrolaimus sp. PS1159 TaxID=55785 RepID=A0AC35FL54_9BILA
MSSLGCFGKGFGSKKKKQLKLTVEQQNKTIDELTDTLNSEKSTYETEIARLQQQLKRSTKQFDDITKQFEDATKRLEDAEKQLDDTAAELAVEKEKNKNLRAEKAQMLRNREAERKMIDENMTLVEKIIDPFRLSGETRVLCLIVGRGSAIIICGPADGVEETENPFAVTDEG